ncbi:hypothetical protein [Runella sp.]|uniref:hypothetical protein n=1 Tax=Runella sp. TaxID=1960881 RepID=UPI003D10AACF
MRKLKNTEMASVYGGGWCIAASGFLTGFSLGAAGMLVAGVATVATGGAATLIAAVGTAVIGMACLKS